MSSPPVIPDHVLLRPIGRGAYGEVWLARNVMGTPRAVKIIWRQQFESDRPYEREFAGIQRYEPVSRSADGLVHVLHVGRNDAEGYFYYVMELADDVNEEMRARLESDEQRVDTAHLVAYQPKTLRNILKRTERLPTVDALRLGLEVCTGLAQLHRKGLVHRDVKPGNIIFVHGRAKLADIGLVSAGGEGRTFVGTEGYIPPEGPGSPEADLYALGVALYEATTGYPPDRFPDVPAEWFREDATEDALELHEVISKACESRRENRYQTAEAMHADLALLQSGQSVRRVRALEVRALWARRVGWAAAWVAAVAVAGFLFAAWRARVAEQTTAKESALRQRAEAAEQDAREKLYNAYLAEARATVLSAEMGRRFRALEAVRQAAAIRSTPELRCVALAALALPDLRFARELCKTEGPDLAWVDPTLTRFVVLPGRNDVEVYSAASQQLLQRLPASTNLNARLPCFSPDGRYLAFKRDHGAGGDSDLEVWDLVTAQRVVLARHAVSRNALAFHPKLPLLLAGRPSGRLVTWDVEKGVELKSWRLPGQWTVAYSHGGDRFAMSYDQGRSNIVEVRDASDASVLARASFPDIVRALAWHPDGRQIAVPCADSTVNVMDASDGTVRTLGNHKAQAVVAGFSREGDFMFSSGWDGEVNIWNMRSYQRDLTAVLTGAGFQFAADGVHAIMYDNTQRLSILEFSRGAECHELPGDPAFTRRVACFSSDGCRLAVPTFMGLKVWDVAHPDAPASIEIGQGLGGVTFGPNQEDLFGYSDSTFFRWRLGPASSNAPGAITLFTSSKTRGLIRCAYVLTRHNMVLTTGDQGICLAPINGPITDKDIRVKGPYWRAAVSDDENWLAVGFVGGPQRGRPVLRVFSLPTLAHHCWLTNPAPVHGLSFAPDGKALAVATSTSLCLWDTTKWQIRTTRSITPDTTARLSYSPDGRVLMLSETTRNASLLDANTLQPLLPLPTWMHPVAMTQDGRQLAVVVEARRVQIWDLAAVRARFRELGIDWAN